MKKNKIFAAVVMLCLIITMIPYTNLPTEAITPGDRPGASTANGPFRTLSEAVGGKNLMPGRQYVAGSKTYWSDESPQNSRAALSVRNRMGRRSASLNSSSLISGRIITIKTIRVFKASADIKNILPAQGL